jgi:hypothetical protein
MHENCKTAELGPHYGMMIKLCALGLVLSGLFTTGCTINHYKVVHNDQYLVIIGGGADKEHGSEDEDSAGEVTAVPVGKKVFVVPQEPSAEQKAF